jgi:hypothetical protein
VPGNQLGGPMFLSGFLGVLFGGFEPATGHLGGGLSLDRGGGELLKFHVGYNDIVSCGSAGVTRHQLISRHDCGTVNDRDVTIAWREATIPCQKVLASRVFGA